MLALAVCVVVSGARGATAIAEWGARASQVLLARLRCRLDPDARRYVAPSVSTVQRVLRGLDCGEIEGVLGDWLQGELTPQAAAAIALDGKTLRGARHEGHAPHLVTAFTHQTGAVLGQRAVSEKSNEITAVKPLLDPLKLAGQVVTADALHTQSETARYLVEDKKAHYLFTVKDNQPTLKDDIERLNLDAVPPQHTTTDKGIPHRRCIPWTFPCSVRAAYWRAIGLAGSAGQNGSCAQDQQRSKVSVTRFGDAAQPGFAAGAVLTGHEAEPG